MQAPKEEYFEVLNKAQNSHVEKLSKDLNERENTKFWSSFKQTFYQTEMIASKLPL